MGFAEGEAALHDLTFDCWMCRSELTTLTAARCFFPAYIHHYCLRNLRGIISRVFMYQVE